MNSSIFSKPIQAQVQKLELSWTKQANIDLYLQRDDLIHPHISGNKWRKLKPIFEQFELKKPSGILSFGGPFSNHLVACAEACFLHHIPFVACLRGHEEESRNSNFCLDFLQSRKAKIHWIDRSTFRQLRTDHWKNPFPDLYPDFDVLPEGGQSDLALKSCEDISEFWTEHYDFACASIGTGTTFSGLVNGLPTSCHGIGFLALKDQNYLDELIDNQIIKKSSYHLNRDFHFGGFGKHKDELIEFMNDFYKQTKVPLDPIYTGKMLFGIRQLCLEHYFPEGSKLIAIHTGGLSGIRDFNALRKRKHQSILDYV
ncbi:MAG: 1-aminocyclopropane-1-carboxylate deaminase/D-cysteine desulfhydrase [Flavobacteriales bacterium]